MDLVTDLWRLVTDLWIRMSWLRYNDHAVHRCGRYDTGIPNLVFEKKEIGVWGVNQTGIRFGSFARAYGMTARWSPVPKVRRSRSTFRFALAEFSFFCCEAGLSPFLF